MTESEKVTRIKRINTSLKKLDWETIADEFELITSILRKHALIEYSPEADIIIKELNRPLAA